jgi:hypothetical protein
MPVRSCCSTISGRTIPKIISKAFPGIRTAGLPTDLPGFHFDRCCFAPDCIFDVTDGTASKSQNRSGE